MLFNYFRKRHVYLTFEQLLEIAYYLQSLQDSDATPREIREFDELIHLLKEGIFPEIAEFLPKNSQDKMKELKKISVKKTTEATHFLSEVIATYEILDKETPFFYRRGIFNFNMGESIVLVVIFAIITSFLYF